MRYLCIAACCLLLTIAASGSVAMAEKRVALVVGNGAYVNTAPLPNPANDASDVAAALRATGFNVIEAKDADKRRLDSMLRGFADRLGAADVALFFYAGHGLQVGLQNYLVPVDAKLERERDLEFETVKLDFILRQMEIDREGKLTIVMLDACRDNPLARNLARSMGTRSTAIGRGLAVAATGLGTFIAFATQPGNVALDGDGSRNSPFTMALLKHLPVRGRNLPATMIEVRKDVVRSTNGRQVPWDHSALTGDFYFVPSADGVAAPANASDIAALKERLEKLEEMSRQTSGRAFVVRHGLRIQGDMLPAPPSTANCETRCQTEGRCVGWHLSKDGVCELFSRVAKRTEDQRWKSGVRPNAAEGAGPPAWPPIADPVATARATPPVVPPVLPRGGRDTAAATYSLDENVRIDGNRINESRQPNPDACRRLCATTAGCIAYQHGKKVPTMGQCQLFDRIDHRHEDLGWRSGVKTD